MKSIIKSPEPVEFALWKEKTNADWQPSYDDLSGDTKRAVKSALMREQGYLCCYCERRLLDNDSHIEHFKPQNDPLVDPLDFANMLCSCQDQVKKCAPRHCGNLKGGWFDEQMLVSPLSADCAERFAFMGNGNILSTNPADDAAKTTIIKLGLGIPKLNALREKAIEPFLDPILNQDEISLFVSGYLKQDDQSGELGEFWTTIHYLFKDYATL